MTSQATWALRTFIAVSLSVWMLIQLLASIGTSTRKQILPDFFQSPGVVLRSLSLAERWTMFCPDVSRTCAKSTYVLINEEYSNEVKRFDFTGRDGSSIWNPWSFNRFSMLILRTSDNKTLEPLYQDFAKWILKQSDLDYQKKNYRLQFIRDEIAIPAPLNFVAQADLFKLPSRPVVVREVRVISNE